MERRQRQLILFHPRNENGPRKRAVFVSGAAWPESGSRCKPGECMLHCSIHVSPSTLNVGRASQFS
jgi:hypothetical protein